jgi:hypothetical protein
LSGTGGREIVIFHTYHDVRADALPDGWVARDKVPAEPVIPHAVSFYWFGTYIGVAYFKVVSAVADRTFYSKDLALAQRSFDSHNRLAAARILRAEGLNLIKLSERPLVEER